MIRKGRFRVKTIEIQSLERLTKTLDYCCQICVQRSAGKFTMKGVFLVIGVLEFPLTPFINPPILHPATNEDLDMDVCVFSWPFERASAMYRLVSSEVFKEFPNIKFITHHYSRTGQSRLWRIKSAPWNMSLDILTIQYMTFFSRRKGLLPSSFGTRTIRFIT